MNKAAPSKGRILAMVAFSLSCFGLLLFLWLSFGGPVPLKPKGYRVQVAFPEATQLATEADVRVAGVPVGKVREKIRDPAGNRTLATIELDREYAPLRADARAVLRQKTLLGETFVELTLGTENAPPVPEGGRLANERV
jgi:ABC-type transporter Mla subunit MlaD